MESFPSEESHPYGELYRLLSCCSKSLPYFVFPCIGNLRSHLNAEIGDSNIGAELLKIKHKDDSLFDNLRTNPHLYCCDDAQKVWNNCLYFGCCGK